MLLMPEQGLKGVEGMAVGVSGEAAMGHKPPGQHIKGIAFLAGLGDAAVFIAFVVIGSASHEGILSRAVLIRTTLPFALAWIAAGGVLGMYRYLTLVSPRRALLRAALS